ITCSQGAIEVLDTLCFTGESIEPSSQAIIEAVVGTLTRDPSLTKLEIVVSVPAGVADPAGLSQRRANTVRARMIAAGIAPARLIARGAAAGPPADARKTLLRTSSSTACTP